MAWRLNTGLGLSSPKVMPQARHFHKAAGLDVGIAHKILQKT